MEGAVRSGLNAAVELRRGLGVLNGRESLAGQPASVTRGAAQGAGL
jgi:hypothetical protein